MGAVGILQEAMHRYAPFLRNWLAAQRVTGVQGSSGAILALVHLPLCCLAKFDPFGAIKQWTCMVIIRDFPF